MILDTPTQMPAAPLAAFATAGRGLCLTPGREVIAVRSCGVWAASNAGVARRAARVLR